MARRTGAPRPSALIGLAGAALTGIGDVLILGRPSSGKDFDQAFLGQQVGGHIHMQAKLRAFETEVSPEFQKLPDPWLYETEALISDLDLVRELILKIPVHNDTVLPSNAAIATLWDLRERIRWLAVMRMQSQRRWQKKAERGSERDAPTQAARKKKVSKVASIRGASVA